MTAIYKKELRSYFTSMTGYICMAFMLVVIGIYFAVINLSSGYPYFGYTLSCVIVLFLLMTPVLSMRILAEEKNRKTDQLLLPAPVSPQIRNRDSSLKGPFSKSMTASSIEARFFIVSF